MGELLKYGGSGMVCLIEQLFSVVWHEEPFLGNGERALLLICLRKEREYEDIKEHFVSFVWLLSSTFRLL